MNKQETIERIREYNHSASAKFLKQFDEKSLETYLLRLDRINGHRGPDTRWVRDTTSPAASSRDAA
ncbi:MAG: hypothetical protein ACIAXF_05320 [Phycisphaerales bacterium JB063]